MDEDDFARYLDEVGERCDRLQQRHNRAVEDLGAMATGGSDG